MSFVYAQQTRHGLMCMVVGRVYVIDSTNMVYGCQGVLICLCIIFTLEEFVVSQPFGMARLIPLRPAHVGASASGGAPTSPGDDATSVATGLFGGAIAHTFLCDEQ